jgi:hypothetical protein
MTRLDCSETLFATRAPKNIFDRRCRQECLSQWFFGRQRACQLENCDTAQLAMVLR